MSGKEATLPAQDRDRADVCFNIYQGTVQMGSIFLGFIFAALVQLLTSEKPLVGFLKLGVFVAVYAAVAIASGLVCFHITANQVIYHWRFPYPRSIARNAGGLLFSVGLMLMQLTLAALLAYHAMWKTAAFVSGSAIMLAVLGSLGSALLHRNQAYVVDVGWGSESFSRDTERSKSRGTRSGGETHDPRERNR